MLTKEMIEQLRPTSFELNEAANTPVSLYPNTLEQLCTLALKAARFEKALEKISMMKFPQTVSETRQIFADRLQNVARAALAGDGGEE